MQNIAEINDLACNAIETGDYHTALDVLNCCLGCVKQLKNCRGPTRISDDGSITFDRNEEISNLLNEAKQKLTNNNNNNTNYKRKSMTSSLPTSITVSTPSTTTTTSTTSRGTAVSRPRKRQRFEQQQDETECPCSFTASESATTPSNEEHAEHAYTHNQQSDHDEDGYFVYRKPLRFTKFQWSRIAECSRSTTTRSGSSGRAQQQEGRRQQIEREVELAVSSNLIFNIALSHHLVASAPAKKPPTEKRRVSFASAEDNNSWSSFSDTDDDDDDLSADENGCGYGSDGDSWCDENRHRNDQHALQTEQRLRGALRLYELGFRVHSKRVASAKSISRAPPAAANNGNTVPLSFSSSTTRRRHDQGRSVAPTEAAGTDSSNNNNNGSERDDELRSTTRFALALLNNCAHIHDAFGQTDKAEIFRKRLTNFLMVIVDGSESIYEVIGDDVAVDGYFKNVFTGTVFHTDNAPAAMA